MAQMSSNKTIIEKSIHVQRITNVMNINDCSPNATMHAVLNNKTIFRTVNEWFATWMPWQKRIVLCGITDRCSNNQLEYLSTALEPVFHRDFATTLEGKYPNAPIKRPLKLPIAPYHHTKTVEKIAQNLVQTILVNAANFVSNEQKQFNDTTEDLFSDDLAHDETDVKYDSNVMQQNEVIDENRNKSISNVQTVHSQNETLSNESDVCQKIYPHNHRSDISGVNIASTTDFFCPEKNLEPMHASLRIGQIRQPPVVTDLKVPLQKAYKKSAQWWSGGIQSDRHVVKANFNKRKLKEHFKKQIKLLWQWIVPWEDYEKSDLLVELLKLCEQDLVQFFAECLLQRLMDRNDINWLPDKLLLNIFSFLPPESINVAEMVCRRWRYIAAQDELWMIKCKEMGKQQAIPDLLRWVEVSMNNFVIDWRKAYHELNHIVVNAQMSSHNYAAFKGACLRFIDVITPAKMSSSEQLSSIRSTSASSSVSSGSFDDRQRSIVVDLPIQQVEVFKKDSTDLLDEPEVRLAESLIHMENSDFNKLHLMATDVSWPKQTSDCEIPSTSKNKLSLKEEEKKIVKKKKRKPKKAKEDTENLALDIRPDHEQAKDILTTTTSDERVSEEKMEGHKLVRHLNQVSMMVRAVKRVRRLQGHMNAVCCLKFDRRRIITGSTDRSIRVWDIRSGRSIHKMYGHKGGVRCVDFNDQWIVSGSWDLTIVIWDVVKFCQLAVLIGHTGVVSCLQLINSKCLVTGSHDNTVRMWSLEDFTCIGILAIHSCSVTCLAVDGDKVVSGSTDGLIQISQIPDGTNLQVFQDQTDPISTLAVQGNLILGGTTTGKLYFWNKLTGNLQAAVQLHDAVIHKVAFLPIHHGDARFLTTSGDTSIKEWDLYTMTCVRALQGHKGAVRDVQVSDDRIVSCSDDGNVRIWDLMTPQFKPGDKADEDTIETRTINERQDKTDIKN